MVSKARSLDPTKPSELATGPGAWSSGPTIPDSRKVRRAAQLKGHGTFYIPMTCLFSVLWVFGVEEYWEEATGRGGRESRGGSRIQPELARF